jgi:hypothetical protein
MTPKAPSEKKMWQKCPPKDRFNRAWYEIDGKSYPEGFYLWYQIMSIELPTLVESSTSKDYDIILPPLSPRRPIWEAQKQSRLIESFLISIPIPSVMLYELRYNLYEVIDGQQRVRAVRAFYENKLVLTGLEILSDLNGMRYDDLPPDIKFFLGRKSLSARAILKNNRISKYKMLELKQFSFDRLSTRDVQLERQEERI